MNTLVNTYLSFAIPFAIGLVFLMFGRRVFWVLGGVAFAITAATILTLILEPTAVRVEGAPLGWSIEFLDQGLAVPTAIGLLVGFGIGVIFTIRLPKIASAIVGFLGGVIILFIILSLFSFDNPEWLRRSLLIVFGVLVAIAAIRQPAETVIILSTTIGAGMLVQVLGLNPNSPLSAFVWLILMLFGIIFQTNTLRKQQHKAAARRIAAAVPPTPSPDTA